MPARHAPSRPVAAMAGISVVMVLIALDQTVVGTALPRMVAELQGFGLYPWVAAAYLLTNAILIPVTGRLGDLHGRKPFLLAAIALFTLASALCGMAGSMPQLVLARGLQGIGGGMLVGSAFASVSDLFPDTLERVRWQVMLSAAFGVASALGPVLGGWMTEHVGWRSVFYINLPVGLIALPVVWRWLPHVVHAEKNNGKSLDWLGVLLLTLAIGSLLVTTEFGERLGFTSAAFAGLVATSLLLGGLFVQHQRHTDAPVIPPQLFADPTMRRLGLLAALTGMMMFVLLFYAPLLLQGGFSLSPKEAGLLVTPILVSITVGSVINGRLISRVARPERLFSRGVLLLVAGLAALCSVSADTPRPLLLAIFTLCGLGFGFQLPNLTLQTQSAAGKGDQGAASALGSVDRKSRVAREFCCVRIKAGRRRLTGRQARRPNAGLGATGLAPFGFARCTPRTALRSLSRLPVSTSSPALPGACALQTRPAIYGQQTLIQTLRTLGSMFGASFAGVVVSLGFGRSTGRTLDAEGIRDARVWQLFDSPQVLLRSADQHVLAGFGHSLGFDADRLLAQARLGLIGCIREALAGCLLLAVISYLVSRRLPPFIHRRTTP